MLPKPSTSVKKMVIDADSMSGLQRLRWQYYLDHKEELAEKARKAREARELTSEDVLRHLDYHDDRNALLAKVIEFLDKNDKKSLKIGKLEIRV